MCEQGCGWDGWMDGLYINLGFGIWKLESEKINMGSRFGCEIENKYICVWYWVQDVDVETFIFVVNLYVNVNVNVNVGAKR